MEDEINLNNPENLNPVFQKLPTTPVTPIQIAEEVTGVKRPPTIEKQVEEWNRKPEIIKAGIKADKISTWNFWKYMGIVGMICLVVLAGVAGIYGYILYSDGSLKDTFICSPSYNVTIGGSSCAADYNTNNCGACICNMTLPDNNIKINLNCSG